MSSLLPLAKGLILPDERRIYGGKSLNGGVWLEIDGTGRMEFTPQQALQIATGILKALDIDLEISEQ